jgi:hypothetical protein
MSIARRWSELEQLVPDQQRVADLPLREAVKLLAPPRQAFNSGECEWYSPAVYVDAARAVNRAAAVYGAA